MHTNQMGQTASKMPTASTSSSARVVDLPVEGVVAHQSVPFHRIDQTGEMESSSRHDGPLASCANCTTTFAIRMECNKRMPPLRIVVFFYNAWADALHQVLKRGARLTVWGPAAMIRSEILVVAPAALLGVGIEAEEPKVKVSRGANEVVVENPVDKETLEALCHLQHQRLGVMHDAIPQQPFYEYISLKDLQVDGHNKAKIHCYALVSSFRLPRLTRGSDHVMTLFLIDQSRPDPSSAIVCNLFRKSDEYYKFPQVIRVGDMIRLHRFKVQMWQSKLQLVGSHAFGSHCLVISRRPSASPFPASRLGVTQEGTAVPFEREQWEVKSTSPLYTFDETDHEAIHRLWEWREILMPTTSFAIAHFPPSTLRKHFPSPEEPSTEQVEVVALVVAMIQDGIMVWDGTGVRNYALPPCPTPPSACVAAVKEAVHLARKGPSAQEAELPDDVEVEQALAKGAMAVYLQPMELGWVDQQVPMVRPGAWVRLRGTLENGKDMTITQLPSCALDVYHVAVRIFEQVARMQVFEKKALSFPHTSGLTLTSIEEALGSGPNCLFPLRVTVKSYSISEMGLLMRYEEEGSRVPAYRWCFTLRLEDDTGKLDVLVFDKMAESMLGQGVAKDVAEASDSSTLVAAAKAKLKALCGCTTPIDVVVRSYSSRKRGRDGSVKSFRLLHDSQVREILAKPQPHKQEDGTVDHMSSSNLQL